MRIDFLGRYQEIATQMNRARHSAASVSAGTGFAQTLEAVRNSDTHNLKNFNVLSRGEGELPELARGPMARLRMQPPELASIPPTRVEAHIPDTFPSSEELVAGQPRVNTPTLLSAQRLSTRQGPAASVTPELAEAVTIGSRVAPPPPEVAALIKEVGLRHGVDPALGVAVASAESSFNGMAVSQDGHESKGLFQLLDSTGKHWLEKTGSEEAYQPFDVRQNAELGMRYLRYLHDLFSKESSLGASISTRPAANSSSLEKLAVAAFNAGEGRVASAQERAERAGLNPQNYSAIESYLPETTRDYVRKVGQLRAGYESLFVGNA